MTRRKPVNVAKLPKAKHNYNVEQMKVNKYTTITDYFNITPISRQEKQMFTERKQVQE